MARMLTLADAELRSVDGMLKINPVRTKPMIRPIMWPIFAPSTSRRNNSRRSAERTTRQQRYGMPQSRGAISNASSVGASSMACAK
jgi:hypothetical protein